MALRQREQRRCKAMDALGLRYFPRISTTDFGSVTVARRARDETQSPQQEQTEEWVAELRYIVQTNLR